MLNDRPTSSLTPCQARQSRDVPPPRWTTLTIRIDRNVPKIPQTSHLRNKKVPCVSGFHRSRSRKSPQRYAASLAGEDVRAAIGEQLRRFTVHSEYILLHPLPTPNRRFLKNRRYPPKTRQNRTYFDLAKPPPRRAPKTKPTPLDQSPKRAIRLPKLDDSASMSYTSRSARLRLQKYHKHQQVHFIERRVHRGARRPTPRLRINITDSQRQHE